MSMNVIADDVISEILALLNPVEFVRMSLVCKRLHRLVNLRITVGIFGYENAIPLSTHYIMGKPWGRTTEYSNESETVWYFITDNSYREYRQSPDKLKITEPANGCSLVHILRCGQLRSTSLEVGLGGNKVYYLEEYHGNHMNVYTNSDPDAHYCTGITRYLHSRCGQLVVLDMDLSSIQVETNVYIPSLDLCYSTSHKDGYKPLEESIKLYVKMGRIDTAVERIIKIGKADALLRYNSAR